MKHPKKMTDIHGNEYVPLHTDLIEADLAASDKIVMAVLRKLAFATGEVSMHYAGISEQSRTPLSSLKNKNGIMARLRGKGWIRGAPKDGACISVRMAPNWISKTGAGQDFSGAAAGSAPDPDTEPVPEPVPNRYRAGTEPVPPSETNSRTIVGDYSISGAPVALAGSGSGSGTEAGAPPDKTKSKKRGPGKPVRIPGLTQELERVLIREGRLWTEQVADYIGMDRKASWGNEVRLSASGDREAVSVRRLKPEGSKPWPEDVAAVFGFAMTRYPGADPVMAFRSVIRQPARFKAVRQQIYGHALRMQKSMGYERPQIKLCSLLRLDNAGKDVPASVLTLAGDAVEPGMLLERANAADSVFGPATPCAHAADAAAEARLREAIDLGSSLCSPCWDACWKEAGARFAAARASLPAYKKFIWGQMRGETGYEQTPVLWLMDSVDVAELDVYDSEFRCQDLDFCSNWSAGADGVGAATEPAPLPQ